MNVLIDESLPKDLKQHLSGHRVSTVPEVGWASKSNGELLQLASSEFDAFITADQNLEYQQNIASYDLGVVVLIAPSSRIADLIPLVPRVRGALERITPGSLIRIAV